MKKGKWEKGKKEKREKREKRGKKGKKGKREKRKKEGLEGVRPSAQVQLRLQQELFTHISVGPLLAGCHLKKGNRCHSKPVLSKKSLFREMPYKASEKHSL